MRSLRVLPALKRPGSLGLNDTSRAGHGRDGTAPAGRRDLCCVRTAALPTTGPLPGVTTTDANLGTRLSSHTPCDGDSEFDRPCSLNVSFNTALQGAPSLTAPRPGPSAARKLIKGTYDNRPASNQGTSGDGALFRM